MLDAFIIEQIQRRERKDDRLQPRLEQPGRFPMQPPPQHREEPQEHDRHGSDAEDKDRGITYIDM
jgi:hypothetical protein